MIDSHCHYNLEPIWPNWQKYWQQAQEYGVSESWIPGTSLETTRRAVAIAKQDVNLKALVGLHPTEVPDEDPENSPLLASLQQLSQDENVIGWGEIGLDYYRLDINDEKTRKNQQKWLKAQLALVPEGGLVQLHVRDQHEPEEPTPGNAYWDVLQALEEWDWRGQVWLHCVSGPLTYVRQALAHGAHASFAGNITYPKADHIREIYRLVPSDRRHIETDAPYLAPQAFRGQSCEPWMISATHKFIEENLWE